MTMSGMLLNEFLRLWKKPGIIAVILVSCVSVFVGMKNISGRQGLRVIPSDYKNAYRELTGLSPKEAYDRYKEQKSALTDISAETRLIKLLKEELGKQSGYEDYLTDVVNNAKKITSVSIFADKDSFAYKNALIIAEAYEKLKGKVTINVGPSQGIALWSNCSFCWVVILLIMMIIISETAIKDRESGLLALMFTMRKGRGEHCLVKLMICFISSFIVSFVVLSAAFFSMTEEYGVGDIFRSVQSVIGLQGCTFRISVAEYMLIYYVLTSVSAFLSSVIMFSIASLPVSTLWTYTYIVVLFGLESLLFLSIKENSNIAILKELNIVSFINVGRYISVFGTINLFGNPVWRFLFVVILLLILLGIAIPLSIKLYTKQQSLPVRRTKSVIIKNLSLTKPKHVIIIRHEAYKLLVCGGTALLLVFSAVLRIYTYSPEPEYFENEDTVYYKKYVKMYEGPLTDEKEKMIDDEIQRYGEVRKEMSEALSDCPPELASVIAESYSGRLRGLSGLEMLKMRTETLRDSGGYILYDIGYRMLMFDSLSGKNEIILYILSGTMLILLVSFLFTEDDRIYMERITSVCIYGRGILMKKKYLIGLIVALVIWTIVYVPYLGGVFGVYGSSGISFPVQSVENMESSILSGLNLSVGESLFVIYFSKYLLMVVELFLISIISRRLRSFYYTVVVSLCLFVGPFLVLYII